MDTEGSQSSLSSADSPHDPCKMFIGGLSWQTTQEGLKEYFSKFGDLKECMVMRDPVTKRSRGFGFVTYVDQAGVDKVLAQPRHELDSKTECPQWGSEQAANCKTRTDKKKENKQFITEREDENRPKSCIPPQSAAQDGDSDKEDLRRRLISEHYD
uniref:Musashi RNA binding protein 1a n=1 Tax=Lepisosteus oculatus TaxID=7918 RepID=W5MQ16_LEPOC